MDAIRKKKLLDKKWLGPKLAEFWKSRGWNEKSLSDKTGLTNFNRWANGKARPRWENLVEVADVLNSDPAEIVRYLDPQPEIISDITIKPEHRRMFENLATILSCEDNKERIEGIRVNLHEFAQNAEREIERNTQESERAPPLTGAEYARLRKQRRTS